jgi:hypothetical protein
VGEHQRVERLLQPLAVPDPGEPQQRVGMRLRQAIGPCRRRRRRGRPAWHREFGHPLEFEVAL